ncbi:Retrotransposable element [Phytophthora palmivora]|uniref:Retrotransposable element n=1 Tax=Phytophthora palmivora TaxID=4796 RepID=A0A2P4XB75_9STRA|nr:Retrotransposable element [Phytophthora palmivora]
MRAVKYTLINLDVVEQTQRLLHPPFPEKTVWSATSTRRLSSPQSVSAPVIILRAEYKRNITLSRIQSHIRCFLPSFGKFQFKQLPMGILTAPDKYQSSMECTFVIVYLDDIFIFSETESDHLKHLRMVFQRLREYDVTLNASKCHISRDSVDYLGFALTPNGIQPQSKKKEDIQQTSKPRNKNGLRRFLGMILYYREMMPNKSALTAKLYQLTSKNVPFVWAPEAASDFQDIKTSFARNV